MQQKALGLLRVERRYGELRDLLGVSSGYTSQLLNRLMRHGLIERVGRGRYRVAA